MSHFLLNSDIGAKLFGVGVGICGLGLWEIIQLRLIYFWKNFIIILLLWKKFFIEKDARPKLIHLYPLCNVSKVEFTEFQNQVFYNCYFLLTTQHADQQYKAHILPAVMCCHQTQKLQTLQINQYLYQGYAKHQHKCKKNQKEKWK